MCLNCVLGRSRQFVSRWDVSVPWARSRAGPPPAWIWSWVVVVVLRETASPLSQLSCASCHCTLHALSSTVLSPVDGGDGKKAERVTYYCLKLQQTRTRLNKIRRMYFERYHSQLVIMSLLSLHLLGSALGLHPCPQRNNYGGKVMLLGHIPHCIDFAFRCDPLLTCWLINW